MRHDPMAVTGVVGGHAEFAAVRHGTRQMAEKFRLDDTSLVMTLFWPGVGEKQKNPIERGFRQAADKIGGVIREKADILEALLFDIAEQVGNTVAIGLAADEAHLGVSGGLGCQMLARAKADFEPQGPAGARRKQG